MPLCCTLIFFPKSGPDPGEQWARKNSEPPGSFTAHFLHLPNRKPRYRQPEALEFGESWPVPSR